jgi:hypothetical protein
MTLGASGQALEEVEEEPAKRAKRSAETTEEPEAAPSRFRPHHDDHREGGDQGNNQRHHDGRAGNAEHTVKGNDDPGDEDNGEPDGGHRFGPTGPKGALFRSQHATKLARAPPPVLHSTTNHTVVRERDRGRWTSSGFTSSTRDTWRTTARRAPGRQAVS